MNKLNSITLSIATIVIVSFIAFPSYALAVWWNPFTWFRSNEKTTYTQTINVVPNTLNQSPIIVTTSTTSDADRIKKLEDEVSKLKNTPIIKTQIPSNKTGDLDSQIQPKNNTNQTMDPAEFVDMLTKTKENLENGNPNLTYRQILIDYLFNPPVSSARIASLPSDIQRVLNMGNPDYIQLQIKVLNQSILNSNFKIEQTFQTQINNYLISNGLPITKPIPTKIVCDASFSGTYATKNISGSTLTSCYSN